MTPRERAEALGWVRDDSAWWCIRWTGRGSTHSVVALYHQGPWVVHWRGRHVRYYATEDEALEHALLLLDVWLS